MERLPLVTPGVGVELSLINRVSDGGWGYLSVNVSEESVEFTTGESIPSPFGNDHASREVVKFGVGWRKEDIDFLELEDWVIEFQNRADDPDQELSLSDHDSEVDDWYDPDSEVDCYDELTREKLWGHLDSDFV